MRKLADSPNATPFAMHTPFRQIRFLVHHAWLAFRRAHYFRRSLWIKALMVIAALFGTIHLYWAGNLAPGIIRHFFPDEVPCRIVFSFLPLLIAGDLVARLFVQKVSRQRIAGYLHLPVKRSALALSVLLRSWFSVHNAYLLPFLVPLYRNTVFPVHGTRGFWLVLAGTVLLLACNHALVIWAKTWDRRALPATVLFLLFGAAGVTGILSFPVPLTHLSERLALAFLSADPLALGLPVLCIAALQGLSYNGLLRSFYQWTGTSHNRPVSGNSQVAHLLGKVPVFGHFWALEWKLLLRNRRSSSGFRQWPVNIVLVPLLLHFFAGESAAPFFFVMVFVAGGYGYFHLQYAYSWESRFFDMIAARNIDIYRFIQAKYYFYCMLSMVQFAPMLLLSMMVSMEASYLLAGLFFYVCGPVFAFLMYAGITNSTRINPDKKAGLTFEGTSGTLFLTVLATMFALIILMIPAFLMPVPPSVGKMIVTGTTGLFFMVFHRWWLRATARKMMRRKHFMLNKFRKQ